MQFMYVLQLLPHYQVQSNWTAATNEILGEHWNYLVGLHEKGVMKLVGKTDYELNHPENHGYAIFEASSVEEATEIMNNDPCVKKGVMTAKVHPFRIALL